MTALVELDGNMSRMRYDDVIEIHEESEDVFMRIPEQIVIVLTSGSCKFSKSKVISICLIP